MKNLTNEIKDSIIKINSTNLVYDFINPYMTPEQNESVGTGFFYFGKEQWIYINLLSCCEKFSKYRNYNSIKREK